MICAVSDKLKEKFLAKMVGDVLASARSGQPFSLENYIKDTYKQIFEKTGDRAKAQTFASFIPNNLVAIYSVNKEAVKHLRPAFAEFDMLRDTFEDFDAVGTYLGIGNEAAQQKREEIIANNEASLDVQEDETLGASPEVVLGTAVPTNKSAISAPFKAAGKSALTAFNVVPKENVDPIIQASQQFIAKYHQGQKTNDPAYSGLRIQIIDSRSFEGDIPTIERDFLEANPEYAGVKAIIVNAEGNPIKVDASGNIAEEGTTPQYVINKPSLVNDVFTVKGEAPISEVASSAGVDIETAQEARQKEYRTLYNIRQALQVNPNQKIYLDINTSAGASVTFDSSNPIKLSEIDFKSFGEEFIYEVDPATGRAHFIVSFSNKLIRIDRPGITDVIPAETLAKYLFDTSVPYQTKKEIFESLLFTKDIKVRETAILYKGQPITEEALAQVLKSVTESASGVVTSTYRANVPISSNGSVDIPYYDQNSLKYNTLSTTDYMLKYFNTTARLEETTKPYFNLSFDPALQLETQKAVEVKTEPVSEVKVKQKSDVVKSPSFQLDLASIGEAVANELKESIVNQGLGATFNIQESVDSKIAENINKGKQNSCK
jgi:hypothetical protein